MSRKKRRMNEREPVKQHNLEGLNYPISMIDTLKMLLKDVLRRHHTIGQNHKKTLLSLWSELVQLRSEMDMNKSDTANGITLDELRRVALTVACALFNTVTVDWDIERYGDAVKGFKVMKKYVCNVAEELPQVSRYFNVAEYRGKMEMPAVVLDKQARIAVWHLPDIMWKLRISDYNTAITGIRDHLKLEVDPGLITSWRSAGFQMPEGGGRFKAGKLAISPGWFMQGRYQLPEKLRASTVLQTNYAANFLTAIEPAEQLSNAILAVTAPHLHSAGLAAISKIKDGQEMAKAYSNVDLWPSVFSGLDVIVNRTTPPHRDKGGCSTHYDLLVSLGTHTQAELKLRELGLDLSYTPGTMVLLCGKIIVHEVEEWSGGERICVAHFMKDVVHSKFDIPRLVWPNRDDILGTYCSM